MWQDNVPLGFSLFYNHHFVENGSDCVRKLNNEDGVDLQTIVNCSPCWYYNSNNPTCPNLAPLKQRATQNIFPSEVSSERCTLLLASNLAEPEYLNLECNKKLLAHVVCDTAQGNKSLGKITNKILHHSLFCSQNMISTKEHCHGFLWLSHKSADDCRTKSFPVSSIDEKLFATIFKAVDVDNVIFYINNVTVIYEIKCIKNIASERCQISDSNIKETHGFLVLKENKQLQIIGGNIFECKDSIFVSSTMRCDGHQDCPNSADEVNCTCKSISDQLVSCQWVIDTQSHKGYCGPLFTKNSRGKCVQAVQSIPNNKEYLNEKCVLMWHNELVHTILSEGKLFLCELEFEFPCQPGLPVCFNISVICIFKVSQCGGVLPCPNGAHLRDCTSFECNANFKCDNSYCVPYKVLCNGIWDCLHGEDEACSSQQSLVWCKNMFQCKDAMNKCIHLGNVCDNFADCPLKDDEYSCSLTRVPCPKFCFCLTFSMFCPQVTEQIGSCPYIKISFHVSIKTDGNAILPQCFKIQHLIISKSKFSEMCNIKWPEKLHILDVSFNQIGNTKRKCLRKQHMLNTLLMNNNQIVFVASLSFANLPNLTVLNLSHNPLIEFPSSLFSNSMSVSIVSVYHMTFKLIDQTALQDQNIEVIETTDYQICCVAPDGVTCTAQLPWFRSCSDLLSWVSLRIFYITISMIVLISNVSSILLHVYASKIFQKPFRITVVFLNLCDLLCLAYLALVWVTDLVFQGSFLAKGEWWRSAPPCFIAFGIILCFSVSSVLLLLFTTVSRLLVIVNPIETNMKSTKFVLKCLIYLCSSSCLFSLSSTLAFVFLSHSIPMKLCLPFVDPTNSHLGIKLVTWLVVVGQIVSSIFIIAMNVSLVHNLKKSQANIRKSGDDSNTPLIIQLVIISSTNILCWCPTGAIYITALFLQKYPTELITWSTVVIMPLNSFVNPSVFVVFAIRRLLKDTKKCAEKNPQMLEDLHI